MLLDDLQVNAKFCETSEERRGRGRRETAEEEAETDKTAGPHRVYNLQSERLAEEKPLISGNIPSGTQLPRYKTSCSFCNDMVVYLRFDSLADTSKKKLTCLDQMTGS